MVWWLFTNKEEHEDLKTEVKQAFSSVKQDLKKASDWITHLNTQDKHHTENVEELHDRLSSVETELAEIKSFMAFFSTKMSKQLFKQPQTADYKHTGVEGVQTGVQTPVQAIQSAFLHNLSVMERAIVWTLLNADSSMKLSCEDIAAILNKERSTVRGQLNSIKQKSEGLISEQAENSGKKRFFVEEKVKEMLLSKVSESRGQPGLKAKGKSKK